MAAKTLVVKKVRFKNPYKRFRGQFQRDAKKLPEREAAFTRRRARSIMKKAPKNPQSRMGHPFARKTGKRKGTLFWRKGLYSLPGRPPFYHQKGAFNLRSIKFVKISVSQVSIPHESTAGGMAYAWRVGPMYRRQKHSTPIPQLHEYGGTVRLNKRGKTYKTKNPNIRLRRQNDSKAVYPARPYMRPAAKEARESSSRKSPHSIKKLTRLGGWKGHLEYYRRGRIK